MSLPVRGGTALHWQDFRGRAVRCAWQCLHQTLPCDLHRRAHERSGSIHLQRPPYMKNRTAFHCKIFRNQGNTGGVVRCGGCHDDYACTLSFRRDAGTAAGQSGPEGRCKTACVHSALHKVDRLSVLMQVSGIRSG
jgi:hypothetical protein